MYLRLPRRRNDVTDLEIVRDAIKEALWGLDEYDSISGCVYSALETIVEELNKAIPAPPEPEPVTYDWPKIGEK